MPRRGCTQITMWLHIDARALSGGRAVAGRRPRTLPGRRAENGSTRAAAAESRAAESRAQGHLTPCEPKRKPGAARPGGTPTAPRGSGRGRLRAAAGLAAHRLGLLGVLPLPPPPPPPPRLRLPRPSPALRAPTTPTSAGPGSGRALPLLSPGMVPSQRFVSPPPPLISTTRRGRLLSSPLKPTWRRQPERE